MDFFEMYFKISVSLASSHCKKNINEQEFVCSVRAGAVLCSAVTEFHRASWAHLIWASC